MLKDN